MDFENAEPVLQPLLDYWIEARADRNLPSRGDIDPVDIPHLLKHIGLIDVEYGPRFHYRLVGSYMNEIFGRDFTGTYLDQSKHGGYRDFLADLYGQAVADRRPVFSEAIFDYGSTRQLTIRRLILPLAPSHDDPVNMLLFSNIFDLAGAGHRAQPMLYTRMDMPFIADDISAINETDRVKVDAVRIKIA